MKLISLLMMIGSICGCTLVEAEEELTEAEVRTIANGFWQDESNPNFISNAPGFVSWGDYGIDTSSDSASVLITWESSGSCTSSVATIDGNKIVMEVEGYNCQFTIEDSVHIIVTFTSANKSYLRHLIKTSVNPSFPCISFLRTEERILIALLIEVMLPIKPTVEQFCGTVV